MAEVDDRRLIRALETADLVLVDLEWFRFAENVLNGKFGCPFCGSKEDPQIVPESDDAHERKGCLGCGEWWSPVRLK